MTSLINSLSSGFLVTTFSDIFKSNFLENITSVSILDMLIAIVLAFGMGMFIFLVYKKKA